MQRKFFYLGLALSFFFVTCGDNPGPRVTTSPIGQHALGIRYALGPALTEVDAQRWFSFKETLISKRWVAQDPRGSLGKVYLEFDPLLDDRFSFTLSFVDQEYYGETLKKNTSTQKVPAVIRDPFEWGTSKFWIEGFYQDQKRAELAVLWAPGCLSCGYLPARRIRFQDQ